VCDINVPSNPCKLLCNYDRVEAIVEDEQIIRNRIHFLTESDVCMLISIKPMVTLVKAILRLTALLCKIVRAYIRH